MLLAIKARYPLCVRLALRNPDYVLYYFYRHKGTVAPLRRSNIAHSTLDIARRQAVVDDDPGMSRCR